MKKLQLDSLAVDSFATTNGIAAMRGTVAGHVRPTLIECPYSYGGTCAITCRPAQCDTLAHPA
jgi:hypothetical protein